MARGVVETSKKTAPLSCPLIAVVLDENTSQDATRYEAPKTLFRAIKRAGGQPLGIPYLGAFSKDIVDRFDGLVSPGGRFVFPPAWYGDNPPSRARPSERCAFEIDLVERFVATGKPVFGICNGMQILAGLKGAGLTGDVTAAGSHILAHNGPDVSHEVTVVPGTRLADLTGGGTFKVNSLHDEAVIGEVPGLTISAHASDGTIEAVEYPDHPFAMGVQWHQERYDGADHPANALFAAFVAAARG